MFFKQIRAGGDRNFSYIIADEVTRHAAVFDPGLTPKDELDIILREGLSLKYIINTHDHFDHTGGNSTLAQKTGAKIAMYESSHSKHDISLKDGDILYLGVIELQVFFTPGHTNDSICVLAGKELITGDTLFVGKVGGTGFGNDARQEYDSLHNKLMKLPPDTRVWPGHDYGVRSSSTIGDELKENPFILRDSFESFIELKQNWAEFKRIHGIA
ncbi:MAG: MBL fold metallo-hydrolase [Candidatus Latescibacteria bacterium]|nr:MBL fold metallo-hydrolase [Candidatus Latescibacterota bacterium]